MQLPSSGRIVLIDDDTKEAQAMMQTLGLQCVPYLYFDGSVQGLPENPPGGVRFVFLDIELKEMKGQDAKTQASGLTGRLKRIISASNGPYVIIFWTKHKEVIEQVLQNCDREGIAPVSWLDLEKSECHKKDGKYDISKITAFLKEKLASIGAFQLYVEWENTVNSASKQFVSDFSSLIGLSGDWSGKTSALFYKLYKSYVGKNILQDKTEQFKCACHLMNRSFLHTLENTTSTHLKLPDAFELTDGSVNADTMSKLNSSLFIGNAVNRPSPGNVYIVENDVLRNALANILFSGNAPTGVQLCGVIITPECDIAHNKTVKLRNPDGTESPIHRVVFGLLFSPPSNPREARERTDARFPIGPFWYDSSQKLFVVHLSTLSYVIENILPPTYLFALKRDLLFDLQSKSANHVNRLGNLQVE